MFNGNINLPTVKVLSTPLLTMVATLILLLISVNYFGPRLPNELKNVQTMQKDVQILNGKLEVLKSFTSDVANDRTDITYLVLPDSNPAAVALAQMRRILTEQGVETIERIELSDTADASETVKNISILIEFPAEDVGKIISILYAFQKTAPLVTIDEVKISTVNEITKAEVDVGVFWSELPKTLPNLSQPISSLSSEERSILETILTFQLPDFSQNVPTDPTLDRQNPFN